MVARYKPNGTNGSGINSTTNGTTRGRPSLFKEEFIRQAEHLCMLGATDLDLAKFFNVNIATLYYWKNKYPQFSDALKVAKKAADERVERSLYQRAIGYSHPTEKIFNDKGRVMRAEHTEHYPPDTTACIFWLKNRQPEVWREKIVQEHTGPNDGPIQHSVADELKAKLDQLVVPSSVKVH